MGVAQLEVPAACPCRGHYLRALDPDPEAAPCRGRAHSDRGLARGRAHGRRSPVRRGRGRRQRHAQRAGHPGARNRAHSKAGHRRARNTCSVRHGSSSPRQAAPPYADRQWGQERPRHQGCSRVGNARQGPRGYKRSFGATGEWSQAQAQAPLARLSAAAERRRTRRRSASRNLQLASCRDFSPSSGHREPPHARDPAITTSLSGDL